MDKDTFTPAGAKNRNFEFVILRRDGASIGMETIAPRAIPSRRQLSVELRVQTGSRENTMFEMFRTWPEGVVSLPIINKKLPPARNQWPVIAAKLDGLKFDLLLAGAFGRDLSLRDRRERFRRAVLWQFLPRAALSAEFAPPPSTSEVPPVPPSHYAEPARQKPPAHLRGQIHP